ncbi:hypothetical protein RIVM261_041630 [Rivularia sp. IAM M-261]|nr:hypothetical protein RIVM261_041630 [Rivularia sp. IAM M-261]
MFERVTEKTIKVVMLAQEEARRIRHNFVDTKQFFLGLIREGTGITAQILISMIIRLKSVRIKVEKIIGQVRVLEVLNTNFAEMRARVISMVEILRLRSMAKDTTVINKHTYKCTYCSHEVISIMPPSECDICGSSAIVLLE